MYIDLSGHHDVAIAVVLHDFEYLYLVCFEGASVAVDEVAEEVDEFAFVEAFFWFSFDVFADFFDEFEDVEFVVEHGFVVIIHFFEEVDAAYVSANVVYHFGYVPLHECFDLVEVFDECDDEVVAHV